MSINLNDHEPEIRVTLKQGKVFKETFGFHGGSCVDASKFIEDILKPTEQKVEFKAEYLQGDNRTERGLIA
jgi:hypothetical protein